MKNCDSLVIIFNKLVNNFHVYRDVLDNLMYISSQITLAKIKLRVCCNQSWASRDHNIAS